MLSSVEGEGGGGLIVFTSFRIMIDLRAGVASEQARDVAKREQDRISAGKESRSLTGSHAGPQGLVNDKSNSATSD